MNGEKSAIIIGAGVGGVATAIKLAQNGYRVKVYEKNATPGGRCGQILREGHRFDLGATIILMPSIYRSVFKSLGLNLDDCFEVKPLPEIYKLYFDDHSAFSFTTDEAIMKTQLEKLEPGSFKKFKSYISTGYKLFEYSMDELLGRNFFSLSDFITLKNVRLLFKIKTHIRHINYVSRFFKHPHLKVAFTFQNIYVGQDPNKAPALFSMLPAAEIKEGSFFPIGGMYKIVEKLVSTATDLGVEFFYNQSVTRIAVKKDKAEHVVLEDGTWVVADIIVANADLPYVYHDLLPDRRPVARLDRMKLSCSAIVFHWGLDRSYRQLSHHNVFLSEPFSEGLNQIFKEKSMSARPSFYVHAPVGSDPSSAPVHQDSISIIVPVGYMEPKKEQDWNELKKVARTFVLERLKQEGLEDLEDHIKFEICTLPQNWSSSLNIFRGSVFGSINHSILQMGYFRPHNKHNRYKNLYFVGGSTHPGNGVPLVLLSSRLTTERILKDTKDN